MFVAVINLPCGQMIVPHGRCDGIV